MRTRTYKIYWTEDDVCVINDLNGFCTSDGRHVDGAMALLAINGDITGKTFGLYYPNRDTPDEDGHVQIRFTPVYDDAGNHILIEDDKLYEAPFLIGSSKYDRLLKCIVCNLYFYYK